MQTMELDIPLSSAIFNRMQVLLFFILSVLWSCSHSTSFSLEKLYRKDLVFSHNGTTHKGILVADNESSYHFRLLLPYKPRLVKVHSCHRELVFRNPGKYLDIDYRPETGIEDAIDPCFLEFASFSEDATNQTALIDFHRGEKLAATLTCNGEKRLNEGVSICQSRMGLLQRIEFQTPVRAEALEGCTKLDQKKIQTFILPISPGLCLYYFFDGKDYHKLVTIGYDDIVEISPND